VDEKEKSIVGGFQGRPNQSRKPESWRVFCAIDLPEAVREKGAAHVERLRVSSPQAQVSWNRKQNIHLTMKFLGELPVSRVDNLSAAAARAVGRLSPFEIYIEGPGVFPKHGPPRVLWIGVRDNSGKLATLSSRFEEECAKEGFVREKRPFHPHLTLARLRQRDGAQALAAKHQGMHFEPLEIVVHELLVIRSELSPEGSKYTVISRHQLEL
jgi:RNA 2',3'-cyclic 3'-phosphodiesterase